MPETLPVVLLVQGGNSFAPFVFITTLVLAKVAVNFETNNDNP